MKNSVAGSIYTAFGLNISSKHIDLPELVSVESDKYDIEIIKQKEIIFHNCLNEKFQYNYKNLLINNDELILHVDGIADFKVSGGKKVFWRNSCSNFSDTLFATAKSQS